MTITLTDILWFVCDGCRGHQRGTLLNPYTSVGAFSTANTGAAPAPQPNHKIYIQSGTYDGPSNTLALRNGQQVWGQGVAASEVLPTPVNAHPNFAALTAGRPTRRSPRPAGTGSRSRQTTRSATSTSARWRGRRSAEAVSGR